ncbi:DUF2303 family protein [Nocardia sp. NPDC055049]
MSTNTTEAAALADIARDTIRYGSHVEPVDGRVYVTVLRDDENLDARSHEKFAELPYRPRGTSRVTDIDSFVRLLARPTHDPSVIFAHESAASLTAVLNYDGWRDHRIELVLSTSDQLQRWTQRDGQLFPQSTFAELIEDGLADIIDPTAAEMLELAQTFHATKSVAFESGVRIATGAVRFQYHEEIDAKAGRGGELQVPSSFLLGIPIYRGGDRIEVRANLRYRIGRDGLQLGFKLVALDDIMRASFTAVVNEVTGRLTDTDHEVVVGPQPAVISPLP